MFDGVYKMGTGLIMEMNRQESIARNLTGSALPGYRREYLVTRSFKEEFAKAAREDSEGSQLRGVGPAVVKVDFSRGAMRPTGRSLDFALEGPGFFAVTAANGDELFTRSGAFRLDPEGRLLTQSGLVVEDTEGRDIVFLPGDDIQRLGVDRDGTLIVRGADGIARQLARLRIIEVPDTALLERCSAGCFRLPEEHRRLAREAIDTQVANQRLESANVTAVEEMAVMIQSLREFEAGQRLVQTSDDATKRHIQMI